MHQTNPGATLAQKSLSSAPFPLLDPAPDSIDHGIVDNRQNNKPSTDDLGDQQMPGVPHPFISHTVAAVAQMIVYPSTNRPGANALWVLNEVFDRSNDEGLVTEGGV